MSQYPENRPPARMFNDLGIDTFDALHPACAQKARAHFLTTDDALIKVINKKYRNKITVEVKNPVQWLMEVTANGSKDA